MRDSGIALLALATIGLVAVVLWPHGPTGEPEQSIFGVNRTVVTPGPTGEVDAATAEPTADGRLPVSRGPRSRHPMRRRRSSRARRRPPGSRPRSSPRARRRGRPRGSRRLRHRRRSDPDPDDGSDPDTDARTDPDTDARRDADADSGTHARADPDPDARADADTHAGPDRVTVAASRLCYTAAAVSGRP